MAHNEKKQDANNIAADQITPSTEPQRVSAGNPFETNVKSDGIKIRGTGAAIKGITARGPMA